jgi:hypothetical protein
MYLLIFAPIADSGYATAMSVVHLGFGGGLFLSHPAAATVEVAVGAGPGSAAPVCPLGF